MGLHNAQFEAIMEKLDAMSSLGCPYASRRCRVRMAVQAGGEGEG